MFINNKSPADVLSPLYHACTHKKPGQTFIDRWKQDGLQKNFDEAKEMLMRATQLVHPDPNKPLALRTDASKTSIGASLEQFEDNRWQPLGFWSKGLKPNQTR